MGTQNTVKNTTGVVMIRDVTEAWHWRAHGCEQRTHVHLKKCRPGQNQVSGVKPNKYPT